jgi:hypothetical protein
MNIIGRPDLIRRLREALSERPAVVLIGPQNGKGRSDLRFHISPAGYCLYICEICIYLIATPEMDDGRD